MAAVRCTSAELQTVRSRTCDGHSRHPRAWCKEVASRFTQRSLVRPLHVLNHSEGRHPAFAAKGKPTRCTPRAASQSSGEVITSWSPVASVASCGSVSELTVRCLQSATALAPDMKKSKVLFVCLGMPSLTVPAAFRLSLPAHCLLRVTFRQHLSKSNSRSRVQSSSQEVKRSGRVFHRLLRHWWRQ